MPLDILDERHYSILCHEQIINNFVYSMYPHVIELYSLSLCIVNYTSYFQLTVQYNLPTPMVGAPPFQNFWIHLWHRTPKPHQRHQ